MVAKLLELSAIVAFGVVYFAWWWRTWNWFKTKDRHDDARDSGELCLGQEWQYGCAYHYEEIKVGLCGRPQDAHFCVPE